MNMRLWQGEMGFNGPLRIDNLEYRPGVYVVCNSRSEVIDIGQSDQVRARVDRHDREECWIPYTQWAVLHFYVYYDVLDELQRRNIEGRLRWIYQPPCGKR